MFAYVGFLIGKKNGAKGKYFEDKNGDDIPDFLQKVGDKRIKKQKGIRYGNHNHKFRVTQLEKEDIILSAVTRDTQSTSFRHRSIRRDWDKPDFCTNPSGDANRPRTHDPQLRNASRRHNEPKLNVWATIDTDPGRFN